MRTSNRSSDWVRASLSEIKALGRARFVRSGFAGAGGADEVGVAAHIRGVRIGLDRDYAFKAIDRGLAAAIDRALQVLNGLGATIVDVRMPDLSGMLEKNVLAPSCPRRA